MSLIVAWDPGSLSGIAVWQKELQQVILVDQFTEQEVWDWTDEHCGEIDHAQVEQFLITSGTGKKSRQPEPLFVIGFLRYKSRFCEYPLEFSKPSDVMKQFPDEALKQAGVYKIGKPHGNDALRHLCYRLVRDGHLDARRFLIK